MSRVPMFSSPLLLGFDQLERTLERLAKNAEGYPPYNIERIGEHGLRITLAVAGFASDDLAIELVENQLTVRGKANARTVLQWIALSHNMLRSFALWEAAHACA